MEIHDVFHVSLLSPYDDPTAIGRPAPTRPPPEIRRGEPEYEVERVLDTRLRRRKREYLVKCKGYPDADTSWEPEDNLANATGAIDDFFRANPDLERPGSSLEGGDVTIAPHRASTGRSTKGRGGVGEHEQARYWLRSRLDKDGNGGRPEIK